MIRLLLLIPTLDRSGAEKQFALLAGRLPRDEFDVRVVALTRGGPFADELREADVPVEILEKRWKFDPLVLRRLQAIVRDWHPDVVNSWMFTANAYARLVAGKRGQPPVVASERCVDSWKAGWQLWLDRRQAARTARLVGNSQAVAGFYRDVGFPAERVVVIPNAIEVPEIDPEARREVLPEFNVPAEARIVMSVGRLAPQKRVHDLVWAMQLLKQLTSDVYLLLVGDGPERGRLRDLAEHFGCLDIVRFAGHRDDVPRLLQAADVFWLASEFEGQSNALMEAMAAGLPVVVSDIAPNRELVTDREHGHVVRLGDSVGFAQYTDRLLADAERSRQMGEAGRERMRREFAAARMVDAYAELFRRVARENAN